MAIQAVGSILAPYDSDGRFPVERPLTASGESFLW